jgi:Rps23 Pro-64 3,4-dihydroxylase Tpa1-like proline 4-hydroxylase
MELKNFVSVYDNILPEETLQTFLKVCQTLDFEDARIANNQVDKSIRKVKKCDLGDLSSSMTNVHWFNVIRHTFYHHLKDYLTRKKIIASYGPIEAIQVLKYEETDHYDFHHDSGPNVPRTFSSIFFVNDDYQGGELCFQNPNRTGEYSITKKANRMIIWPSSFLFPHKVMPVKNGERFSVVAWTL